MSKIGNLKNYGGAGRITLAENGHDPFLY